MGRAPCCDKNGLKKGPWTPEEDQKLIDYIQEHGYGNWRTLPKNAGLQRCGKSCRLRWTNYLRPDIKRGRFSFEEEETIIQLHSILGNKWSAIASCLPGRTDNEIKNYWNTHIRKKLLRMGIDPVTHSPRLDLLDLSSILNPSLYANSSSQMNSLQRLLNIRQPVMGINPEILKLASSLISSQQNENINFSAQNGYENHMKTLEIQNQIPQFFQIQDPIQEMPFNELIEPNNIELYPSNFTDFSSQQNSQLIDWQTNNGTMDSSTLAEDYFPELPRFCCYGSEEQQQSFMEPPLSETSTFYSNNSNQNFSFASVISTPSSSNSAYMNGSSTEDERESYGSSTLKFEIPDILDVSEFM